MHGRPIGAVGNTTICSNFPCMQIFRFIMVLAMIGILCCYCWIYLLNSLHQFHFWALLSCVLAEGHLFVGSGKELVKHKLTIMALDDENIKPIKSRLWQTGLIWYTLALPTIITSNVIYFFDLPGFLRRRQWGGSDSWMS